MAQPRPNPLPSSIPCPLGAGRGSAAAARDWHEIAEEIEPEVFEAFLARHKDPVYVALAKARLKRIRDEQRLETPVEEPEAVALALRYGTTTVR